MEFCHSINIATLSGAFKVMMTRWRPRLRNQQINQRDTNLKTRLINLMFSWFDFLIKDSMKGKNSNDQQIINFYKILALVSVIISFFIFISSFSILSQSALSLDCRVINWSIVLLEFSSSFVLETDRRMPFEIILKFIDFFGPLIPYLKSTSTATESNCSISILCSLVTIKFLQIFQSDLKILKEFTLLSNILQADLKSLFLYQLKYLFHLLYVMELPLQLVF